MAQNEANAPTDFEAPAPVCVCGLLVVAALTKGGHPHWAIGGMIFAKRTLFGSAVCEAWCRFYTGTRCN